MATSRGTKAELLEENKNLRQRIDNAPYTVVTTDKKGTITSWNEAALKFTGYTSKEVVGKHFSKLGFLRAKDIPKYREILSSIIKGKMPEPFVLEYHPKDGTPHYAELSVSRLQEAGKNTGFLVFGRDITERRQAEEQLRESESRFRRLVEHSADGIVMVDETGNVIEWNTAQERITGLRRDEVHGRPFWDVFHQMSQPDELSTAELKQVKNTFQSFRRTGQAPWFGEAVEREIQRPDGVRRTVQAVAYPIAAREGWMTGIVVRDLSEQKQHERALRESQERYRELVERAGVAIMIDDEGGDILYFNDRFAEMYGYTVDEMKEQSIETLVHPDDVDRIREYHEQRMKGLSAPAKYEFRGLLKDSSVVYHEVDIVDLKEGKKTVGTRCYFWDITERKQAESTLRKSEERYRELVEEAGIAIGTDDIDGNIKYGNEKFAELFGYSVEEMKGQSLDTIVHPDDLERVKRIHAARVKGMDAPSRYEFKGIRKDGSPLYIEVAAVAQEEEEEEEEEVITGTRSYFWDVTDRKQADDELRGERDKLKQVFESIVDGVYIVNQDCDIEYVNPVLVADFGPYESRKCYAYFHDREEVCPWCKNQEVWAGKTVRWEWYSFKNDKTYDLVDTPLRNADGTISKLEIFRDITDRKLAEEALHQSYQQLRMLSARIQSTREEERSNISREIHDELGQNLTAIKMDLSWLQNELLPSQGALINKMESVSTLVDDTIQRVKRISTELRPGLLDDLGIAAAIEWQTQEFERLSGIKCALVIDPEELILDEDVTTTIFRVFQEILSNVVRHAEATNLDVSLKAKSGSVTLTVFDNGRGITSEELSRPTSLGIMGMRERIALLGGEFEIKGKKGTWTKVTLRIPIDED